MEKVSNGLLRGELITKDQQLIEELLLNAQLRGFAKRRFLIKYGNS
jgi:hypothetical protein